MQKENLSKLFSAGKKQKRPKKNHSIKLEKLVTKFNQMLNLTLVYPLSYAKKVRMLRQFFLIKKSEFYFLKRKSNSHKYALKSNISFQHIFMAINKTSNYRDDPIPV